MGRFGKQQVQILTIHVNFFFLTSDIALTSNSNYNHFQNGTILHHPGDWKYILEFMMPPDFFFHIFISFQFKEFEMQVTPMFCGKSSYYTDGM